MESVVRVKRSLRRPIRKLTSFVRREKRLWDKHRNKRARGSGRGRRGCNNRQRKVPPHRAAHPRDPVGQYSYHADLEKERKLREQMNTQKNAERSAMRAHFRRKYELPKSPKDTSHLKFFGGKVSLPKELAKIIHPETKAKDNSFNLLSAFQGLNFGTTAIAGKKLGRTPTPLPTGNSCKVM